jgi:hypothetical protein
MSDHDGVEQVITMAWRAHERGFANFRWLFMSISTARG